MRVNLNMLQTFLSVADNASFSKAADESHLSVPAVSMQIKRLEERLGTPLFNRTSRRVELTTAGERLATSGRKAMAEIDVGLAHIQQVVDDLHGRITLACVPTVASARLPRILNAFTRKFPGVSVLVREVPNYEVLDLVRRREVDFGVGMPSDKPCDLVFSPVCQDDYCALIPRSYTDIGPGSVTIQDLARFPLLKLANPSSFREHLDEAFQACGLSVETSYEFMQVNTLVAMAESGLGIALLPRIAVPPQTMLKVARISNPGMSRSISMVTSREHPLANAAAHLMALCCELVPPDVGAPASPIRKHRVSPEPPDSSILLNRANQMLPSRHAASSRM